MHPEIIRTPLQIWRHGSSATGKTVQVKLETLQRTGSFKARGAWNRIRLLRPAERKAGVICASAGNHAQGVALASSFLNIRATIVMPLSTPEIKIIQTRLYGEPEIILYGKSLSEAYHHALALQKERGSIFIPPYDDDAVIAGQATLGLEILEQWPDVDTIVVPVGGGGLIAGIATAVLTHHDDIRVVGVQSDKADAAARSMEQNGRVAIAHAETIADGINVAEIGEKPFEILRKFHVPVIRVNDEEICFAITALCQTAKLVVEPAGAAPAAAILFHPESFESSRKIVCVLSGANINISRFAEILKSHPTVIR
ncbi:MAG: threonine/serine dehydratase [Candidatus Zixiibacteriota bacterium]